MHDMTLNEILSTRNFSHCSGIGQIQIIISSFLFSMMKGFQILVLCAAILAVQGQDPEICPPGEAFWPHYFCSYYYECTNPPGIETCPDPQFWNQREQKCDDPANVPECVGGTRDPSGTTLPMPTTTTTTTTTTGNPITTTGNPPITTTRPPGGDEDCTRDDGTYYIPYPFNCSRFRICYNRELQPEFGTCPEGTLFDPFYGDCNLEENVDCEYTVQCPDSGAVTLPFPGNCSLYWSCTNGNPTLRQCLPGLLYDPVLQTCNRAENVLCPNTCPPNGSARLPHSTNCRMYWQCTNGNPILQECPPEQRFDAGSSTCVPGSCTLGWDDYFSQFMEPRPRPVLTK